MMNKKKLTSAIILALICTIFISFAQLFLKFGADKIEPSFILIITNLSLIIGFVLYAIGALVLVSALKHGDLSVVYPFLSLSFIWVALLSFIFLGESLLLMQWLGIFLVIIGVSFVGWGAKSA